MKLAFRIFMYVVGLVSLAVFGFCGYMALSYGAMSADKLNGTVLFGALCISIALVIACLLLLSVFRRVQKIPG